MYLRPILEGTYLAESDLYEYYLPIFLSPITTWSRFEFGGLPAFADPGDFTAYPPHFLFARLIGSWTALNVSAFVLAASFTYAYVRHLTGSRRAATLAGLAYGASEALMERLPHSGTLHAAAWLPLLLLAVDRVRDSDTRGRWIAVGAIAAACCFLAGHPQPALYIYYCCGLYALIGGWTARAPWGYYLRVAGLFVLGGLLTAIKSLPFVEASLYMARQAVNFNVFAGHANSPAQMLSILFPSVLHDGREAPTYVGLLTLALAGAAVATRVRRDWRIAFWAGIAVFALLMGMGDHTPLASIAFYIPLYWKFRVAARHLILAAFALCVLAGLGAAAIERGAISARVLRWSAATLGIGLGAVAAAMAWAPFAFAFEGRAPLPWTLPVWNVGVWIQLAIGLATIGLVLAAGRAGRGTAWVAAALALLFADALYSLPYRVNLTGLVPITIPAAATTPSVHAMRLAAEVAPLHQRLLAPGGTHRDAVVPAAWARLWHIPIAGGYGPMLLQNHTTLAQMGTNGSVAPSVFGADDVSLDLLAVSRLMVRADDMTTPETFERNGVRWSKPVLELTAGRADCNHPYPRRLSMPLPHGVRVAHVAVVGHLRCSEDEPQGRDVGQLQLSRGETVLFSLPLHAGVEIADRSLGDPAVAKRAAHTAAPIFDDPEATPNEYLVRLQPPAPVDADRLTVLVNPIKGWVAIDRITVVDAEGVSHPVAPDDVLLGDAQRWTPAGSFSTSRTSDRGHDERLADEIEIRVFENRRALPRAWIAREVRTLEADDLREAIRFGQLPDGQPFDPRVVALQERDPSSSPAAPTTFAQGERTATMVAESDGRFDIDVDSPGGRLILSEAFYPGWRARIDGAAAQEVRRVDLDLQSVEIPAGRHRVTFEFSSRTLLIGRLLSALSLAVCAVLAWPRRL